MAKKKWFRISAEYGEPGYLILMGRGRENEWVYVDTIDIYLTCGYALAALCAFQHDGILTVNKKLSDEAKSWLRKHRIEVPE